MDGFHLSQLQNTVSAYLNQLCLEWFVKWPEVGIHFKDSTTGIPRMEAELTSDHTKELSKLVKQRKGVSCIHFLFGLQLNYLNTATMLLLLLSGVFCWKSTPHPVHKGYHQVDGNFNFSDTWTYHYRTFLTNRLQGGLLSQRRSSSSIEE